MSLGNWFWMSRKGGTGGGGLVHPESEDSMAMYGWLTHFSYFKCNGDLQNSHFTLLSLFAVFKDDFICPSNLK